MGASIRNIHVIRSMISYFSFKYLNPFDIKCSSLAESTATFQICHPSAQIISHFTSLVVGNKAHINAFLKLFRLEVVALAKKIG